ncbi:MAG: hypothetical protein HW389_2224 [Bacteroidetes bacterium]|nr:hypothetical protein [Bacteroidota bacterium]
MIVLEACNIRLDSFADVGYCFLSRLALAYTARKTGALGHPETILAWI